MATHVHRVTVTNQPGPAVRAGMGLLALAAGLVLGAAIGLGMQTTVLVAGLLSPFILFATFAWPHWSVLVYIVLVYADLLSILVHYHGMPPLARFAGLLILVAVLGHRLLIRREGLVSDGMTWWLAAYGVVLAVGLLYARVPNLVMVEIVEFSRGFLTYVVVINTLTTIGRLRGTLWALLGMASLLASLTVYQTVTGNFDQDFGGLAQAKLTGITELQDAPRPGGTLGDPNYYGQSLLVLLPVGLYLMSCGGTLAARLAGAAASILLVAAVIFTYSRGDLLALVALLVAAIIFKRPRPQFILGGLLAIGVVLSFLPADYYTRLSSVLEVVQGGSQAIISESSLRGRAGAAQASVTMFADHPILGVGRGNYPLYELDYLEGTNLAFRSQGIPPHDLYLEVAAEQGIVGLIVIGGLLITALLAVVETRRRFLVGGNLSQAELAVWLGIGLFGYMVSSLFLHGAYLYMLWLQLALIVALRQLARAEAKLPRTGD